MKQDIRYLFDSVRGCSERGADMQHSTIPIASDLHVVTDHVSCDPQEAPLHCFGLVAHVHKIERHMTIQICTQMAVYTDEAVPQARN